MSIHQEGITTVDWSINDYLISHCRSGKPDYLAVKAYCDESGISPNLAISMFAGRTAGGSGANETFKLGNFKIKNTEHPRQIKELVTFCKDCGIEPFNSNLFIIALSKVLLVESCSVSRLKTKMKTYSALIGKKVNLDQYLTVIEEVYNRKSQTKVPLKFLAYEEGKRRMEQARFGGENGGRPGNKRKAK